MNSYNFTIAPRKCLLEHSLMRPNWTLNNSRDPNLIWLDKNENNDPHYIDFTKSLLSEMSAESLYTYPETYSLYKKIAKYTEAPIESILITQGSDGVIRSVFETFINEGDVVLHTSPTFAMYSVYCKIFGVKSYTLNYGKSSEGPHLCFDDILKAITELKPKLFCLPNPDSPTGTAYSFEQIEKIVSLSSRQNTIVLIDEAYYEFYGNSASSLIYKYKNLIVARTFAKAWGLAGLRIGYSLACPELTDFLHKIKPMYEVGNFSVTFTNRILDFQSEMDKSVNRLLEGKKIFKSTMEEFGFRVLNNHGNFQHVDFGEKKTSIHKNLSTLVLYRKDFSDECLSGFSRFSIATKEIFSKVIFRIKEEL